MSKRLPTTTKKKIVKEYINGTTVQNLSEKYNVSRGSIYNWIELYDTRKTEGDQDNSSIKNQRDYLRLQDKYNRAKKINEILYKANCSLDILIPNIRSCCSLKFATLHSHTNSCRYSFGTCHCFTLSKGTFYI